MANYDGVHLGELEKRGVKYATLWWYTGKASKRTVESLGRADGLAKGELSRLRAKREESLAIAPAMRTKSDLPTLKEWWTQFCVLYPDTLPRTLRELQTTHSLMVERLGEDTPIGKVTPDAVTKWRAWLAGGRLTAKSGTGKAALATIARHIRHGSVLFGSTKGAAKHYPAYANPFEGQRMTAQTTKRDAPDLTREQVLALIAAGKTPEARCLIALAALAGIRVGEATRLRWGDIKWGRKRLTATATKNTADGASKERSVLMESDLEAVLAAGKKHGLAKPTGDLLHSSIRNNRSAYAVMLAAQQAIGLAGWDDPFHGLRRWRETSWAAVYPGPVVSAWMGHSAKVAIQHYLGVQESMYTETRRDYADLNELTDGEWEQVREFAESVRQRRDKSKKTAKK